MESGMGEPGRECSQNRAAAGVLVAAVGMAKAAAMRIRRSAGAAHGCMVA